MHPCTDVRPFSFLRAKFAFDCRRAWKANQPNTAKGKSVSDYAALPNDVVPFALSDARHPATQNNESLRAAVKLGSVCHSEGTACAIIVSV